MKSWRNSQSIPLQSLRNRVLTCGNHDELKIFLEIRLIPSRIDQKLSLKEGKYMLLKEGIRPEIVGDEMIVEADLQRRGSDFLARRCNSQICGEFSSKLASMYATFAPRSGHDHAVIGPRSWLDPRSLASNKAFRSSGR